MEAREKIVPKNDGIPLDQISDEKVEAALGEFVESLNTEQLLKDLLYDGFDTYEDYVRYGDSFVKLKPVSKDTALLPPVKK